MKIVLLKGEIKIKDALRNLKEELVKEHPHYETWIQNNKETFKNGTRLIYAIQEQVEIIGYIIIHYLSNKSAKIDLYVLKNKSSGDGANCYELLENSDNFICMQNIYQKPKKVSNPVKKSNK